MREDALSLRTTTFEALLGILSMGPMTGYEIKQRIEISIGNFWSESFGQIYPALARLQRHGFVDVTAAGKTGRRVYSLTAAGREELKRWLKVMPQPRKGRNEELLKLFFGGNSDPATVRSQVLATRARYAADLERYTALEPQVKQRQANNPGLPYFLMTLSHGSTQARAMLAWADETIAALESMQDQPEAPESAA